MDLLSADEARDMLLKSGITAVPGEKALREARKNKVFSGKKEDGTLWTLTKTDEGCFSVKC